MKNKRNRAPQVDIATLQPTELNELKNLVKNYLARKENIEVEIEGLKESLKDLKEEFEGKVDIKTLDQVLKVLKIESAVAHKSNFDSFYEVLKDDFVNNLTNE